MNGLVLIVQQFIKDFQVKPSVVTFQIVIKVLHSMWEWGFIQQNDHMFETLMRAVPRHAA